MAVYPSYFDADDISPTLGLWLVLQAAMTAFMRAPVLAHANRHYWKRLRRAG